MTTIDPTAAAHLTWEIFGILRDNVRAYLETGNPLTLPTTIQRTL